MKLQFLKLGIWSQDLEPRTWNLKSDFWRLELGIWKPVKLLSTFTALFFPQYIHLEWIKSKKAWRWSKSLCIWSLRARILWKCPASWPDLQTLLIDQQTFCSDLSWLNGRNNWTPLQYVTWSTDPFVCPSNLLGPGTLQTFVKLLILQPTKSDALRLTVICVLNTQIVRRAALRSTFFVERLHLSEVNASPS